LFARLGRQGIWVRRFQDAEYRLRFGLPGSEAEWARLAAALA
jgi:cobalamin biosynthetic protein CobC